MPRSVWYPKDSSVCATVSARPSAFAEYCGSTGRDNRLFRGCGCNATECKPSLHKERGSANISGSIPELLRLRCERAMKDKASEASMSSDLGPSGASRKAAPASPSSTPPGISEYELLRRIGGGSYGEVWLARNAVGTLRAIKVVYRKTFDTDRPYEREFSGIKKFEPISRSHDSLIDVLHVGRSDEAGYFYYVMELADAAEPQFSDQCSVISNQQSPTAIPAFTESPRNTDHWQLITRYRPRTLKYELERRTRLPIDECLQLGLALTSGLAHLHKNGLAHRDIKPSNIIFVSGVPKLADIGLVAGLDEAKSYVGTEGYIPPEGPGTVQADLYRLGKVLYEASTGKDRQHFPEPLTELGELDDQS